MRHARELAHTSALFTQHIALCVLFHDEVVGLSRIGLFVHPSVSNAVFHCLRLRILLVIAGLPCPFLVVSCTLPSTRSVCRSGECLHPPSCVLLYVFVVLLMGARSWSMRAFSRSFRVDNMSQCEFFLFPPAGDEDGSVVTWVGRPCAKNFVMGSLQVGQGSCSSAPFPSW